MFCVETKGGFTHQKTKNKTTPLQPYPPKTKKNVKKTHLQAIKQVSFPRILTGLATSRLKALDFQWINLAVVLSLRLFFADLLHHFSHMLPCTIWSCGRPQGQQQSNIRKYPCNVRKTYDVGIFRSNHMSATEFELYTI